MNSRRRVLQLPTTEKLELSWKQARLGTKGLVAFQRQSRWELDAVLDDTTILSLVTTEMNM